MPVLDNAGELQYDKKKKAGNDDNNNKQERPGSAGLTPSDPAIKEPNYIPGMEEDTHGARYSGQLPSDLEPWRATRNGEELSGGNRARRAMPGPDRGRIEATPKESAVSTRLGKWTRRDVIYIRHIVHTDTVKNVNINLSAYTSMRDARRSRTAARKPPDGTEELQALPRGTHCEIYDAYARRMTGTMIAFY